jgi:CPA2 family monovalent cation:H+ antiporter-2
LVARLLSERGIEPTVIDMNIDTHRTLRSQGRPVVHGDATRREVLEEAGVGSATSLILSSSGAANAVEAIRAACEINPRIHVVARADLLAQTEFMREAGAAEVSRGKERSRWQ